MCGLWVVLCTDGKGCVGGIGDVAVGSIFRDNIIIFHHCMVEFNMMYEVCRFVHGMGNQYNN